MKYAITRVFQRELLTSLEEQQKLEELEPYERLQEKKRLKKERKFIPKPKTYLIESNNTDVESLSYNGFRLSHTKDEKFS